MLLRVSARHWPRDSQRALVVFVDHSTSWWHRSAENAARAVRRAERRGHASPSCRVVPTLEFARGIPRGERGGVQHQGWREKLPRELSLAFGGPGIVIKRPIALPPHLRRGRQKTGRTAVRTSAWLHTALSRFAHLTRVGLGVHFPTFTTSLEQEQEKLESSKEVESQERGWLKKIGAPSKKFAAAISARSKYEACVRMLFGKYAGCPIENLPDHYLVWLAGLHFSNLGMRKAVQQELRRRERSELNLRLAPEDAGLLLQAIEAGRRALRLNLDQQERLDAIVETLLEALQASQAQSA